jgi:DNA repair protein radc
MALKNEIAVEERPREKAIIHGIQSLNNSELLAIILRTGTRNISVLDLSQKVLNHYQGLRHLALASLNDLMQIKGIKQVKAIEIMASVELAKRLQFLPFEEKVKIKTASDVYDYLGPKLKYEQQEKFIVLFLDTKNQLIHEKVLYIGTLDACVIHPRDIFREAIKCNCARIICAHNHPTGVPVPSKNDIEVNQMIEETGVMMQIQLLDHIIIGFDCYFSLREQGFFNII